MSWFANQTSLNFVQVVKTLFIFLSCVTYFSKISTKKEFNHKWLEYIKFVNYILNKKRYEFNVKISHRMRSESFKFELIANY